MDWPVAIVVVISVIIVVIYLSSLKNKSQRSDILKEIKNIDKTFFNSTNNSPIVAKASEFINAKENLLKSWLSEGYSSYGIALTLWIDLFIIAIKYGNGSINFIVTPSLVEKIINAVALAKNQIPPELLRIINGNVEYLKQVIKVGNSSDLDIGQKSQFNTNIIGRISKASDVYEPSLNQSMELVKEQLIRIDNEIFPELKSINKHSSITSEVINWLGIDHSGLVLEAFLNMRFATPCTEALGIWCQIFYSQLINGTIFPEIKDVSTKISKVINTSDKINQLYFKGKNGQNDDFTGLAEQNIVQIKKYLNGYINHDKKVNSETDKDFRLKLIQNSYIEPKSPTVFTLELALFLVNIPTELKTYFADDDNTRKNNTYLLLSPVLQAAQLFLSSLITTLQKLGYISTKRFPSPLVFLEICGYLSFLLHECNQEFWNKYNIDITPFNDAGINDSFFDGNQANKALPKCLEIFVLTIPTVIANYRNNCLITLRNEYLSSRVLANSTDKFNRQFALDFFYMRLMFCIEKNKMLGHSNLGELPKSPDLRLYKVIAGIFSQKNILDSMREITNGTDTNQ